MAKVRHRLFPEETFRALDEELVISHLLEHHLDVLEVLGPRGAVNQDVIEKDQREFADERLEDVVHQRLECGGCIHQSEGHDEELKMALMRAERNLFHICPRNMRT